MIIRKNVLSVIYPAFGISHPLNAKHVHKKRIMISEVKNVSLVLKVLLTGMVQNAHYVHHKLQFGTVNIATIALLKHIGMFQYQNVYHVQWDKYLTQ